MTLRLEKVRMQNVPGFLRGNAEVLGWKAEGATSVGFSCVTKFFQSATCIYVAKDKATLRLTYEFEGAARAVAR